MATIEALFATLDKRDLETYMVRDSESAIYLRRYPGTLEKLFAPIKEAGFNDFVWVAKGSDAQLISPSDNPDIVFRINSIYENRLDDTPFFLTSPYVHRVKAGSETFKVELLLAGKPKKTEEQKSSLLHEMKLAGWHVDRIEHLESEHEKIEADFWKDVVVIPMRGQDGRIKQVPIISDPSASGNHMDSAMIYDRNIRNRCSSNYPTLQDQAAAYNQAIARDPRLQKLIPEPMVLPETVVFSAPESSKAVSHRS